MSCSCFCLKSSSCLYYINASLHWLYNREHFLSPVQIREELWLADCVSDTFPTQHNTTSPRGGLWQSCSLGSAAFWAVQLESGEGWLSGERHTGPSLGLAVWRCVLQLAKRQTVSPGCQHLLQRLYHLPEAPGGASHPSQTSCRAPDVDLSGPAKAENTAKTQSEPLSGETFVSRTKPCFICRLRSQWGLDKQTSFSYWLIFLYSGTEVGEGAAYWTERLGRTFVWKEKT